MADERSPDHTDDPREQEQGSGGYPESTPSGTEGGDDRARKGPEADAPSPSTEKEADRGHSTGNPGAAG